MKPLVLLCTDGSELSTRALEAGLALLAQPASPMLVTVIDDAVPTLATAVGRAGPPMPTGSGEAHDTAVDRATSVVEDAQQRLDLAGCDTRILTGSPGPAICELAQALSAAAIVMGSRGRGGFTRAVLGSVSDHVVRNAPCTVLVTPTTDS